MKMELVHHVRALVHPLRARYDVRLSEYHVIATAEAVNMENEL